MIEFTPGCVYDLTHLRPFDLELAKQGHPLAFVEHEYASSVRFFAMNSEDTFSFQWWSSSFESWEYHDNYADVLPDILHLAPLAVGDGCPLHVGDEIEIITQPFGAFWQQHKVVKADCKARDWKTAQWRWPKE